MDNAIRRINRYPGDRKIAFPNSDLNHWIVICPQDIAIQRLNKRDQKCIFS